MIQPELMNVLDFYVLDISLWIVVLVYAPRLTLKILCFLAKE